MEENSNVFFLDKILGVINVTDPQVGLKESSHLIMKQRRGKNK